MLYKEVLNNILELYHKGKFEEILKQENELINLYLNKSDLDKAVFLDQQT